MIKTELSKQWHCMSAVLWINLSSKQSNPNLESPFRPFCRGSVTGENEGMLALLERAVRKCLLTLDKPPSSPGTALGSLIWASEERAWVRSPAVPAFHLCDLTGPCSSPLQTPSPAARQGFRPTGVPWQFLVQWRAGERTGSQHMISSYFISLQVLNNFTLLSLWTQSGCTEWKLVDFE